MHIMSTPYIELSRSPLMLNHRENRVRYTYYPRRHLGDDAVQLAEK